MNKKPLSPFQQALLDAQLEQWKDVPSEKEIEIPLSPEFEEKGNELLRGAKPRKTWHNNAGIRRMAFVAAVLTILIVNTLAIPSIREGLARFFIVDSSDTYPFDFDDAFIASAPPKIEKVYKPAYIPEGFREESIINSQWVVYMWHGGGGKMITFGQYPLSNESVQPQQGDGELQEEPFRMNGHKVYSMRSDSSRMYFWTDNTYFYRLVCSDSVPTDESNKMLNNIKINENAAVASLQKQP